jgi:hypothetical protein
METTGSGQKLSANCPPDCCDFRSGAPEFLRATQDSATTFEQLISQRLFAPSSVPCANVCRLPPRASSAPYPLNLAASDSNM